ALPGVALVQDHGGDVLHVGVDEAEEDELEDGHHEREAQRARVPLHLDRLLAEDRREARHWLWTFVSRTKTSSSVGSMGRIRTRARAAASRSVAIVSSRTRAWTRRCRALPKMVTSST